MEWIPCYERMPRIGRTVLVSVSYIGGYENCHCGYGRYQRDGWRTFDFDGEAFIGKTKVWAWMPIPKPFGRTTNEITTYYKYEKALDILQCYKYSSYISDDVLNALETAISILEEKVV